MDRASHVRCLVEVPVWHLFREDLRTPFQRRNFEQLQFKRQLLMLKASKITDSVGNCDLFKERVWK
eukprot:1592416-Amphidinium_carterae.1